MLFFYNYYNLLLDLNVSIIYLFISILLLYIIVFSNKFIFKLFKLYQITLF